MSPSGISIPLMVRHVTLDRSTPQPVIPGMAAGDHTLTIGQKIAQRADAGGGRQRDTSENPV